MIVIDNYCDEKRKCISLVTKMKLKEYRQLAYNAYTNTELNGNLDGQRGVIKKTAASNRIKKRMQDDFVNGAIFPQVVLGVENDIGLFKTLQTGKEIETSYFEEAQISIIDGMQRSYIYFNNYTGNEDRIIRVEFWIAEDGIQLLYRMLVLNTGQTPWNTRRQVEVVFGNLLTKIEKAIKDNYADMAGNIQFIGVDDQKRRTKGGIYPKKSVVELYLGFSTRSVKTNVSDDLAEEYQRFDMMESIEHNENFDLFIYALLQMAKMDLSLEQNCPVLQGTGQFLTGKDIFGSAPVRIAFIVSCSEFIMGKMGIDRSVEEKEEKRKLLDDRLKVILNAFVENKGNNEYFCLDLLNDYCSKLSKSRFGDEMRKMFRNVFTEMIKDDEFKENISLERFWRES